MLLSGRVALGVLGTALLMLAGCAQQTTTPVRTGPSRVTTRERASLTADTQNVNQTSNDDLRKILADQIRKAATNRGTTTPLAAKPANNGAARTAITQTSGTTQTTGATNTTGTSKTNGKAVTAKVRPAEHVISSGRNYGNSSHSGTKKPH